jgi:hypothetical protein
LRIARLAALLSISVTCASALLSSSCPIAFCGVCGLDEVCVNDVDEGDHCAPPAGRGEICQRRSDTPPDGELDHACAAGLLCLYASGDFVPISICVPSEGPRLLGEPCDDAACDEGLECVAGFFPPAICERGEGMPCTFPEDCASRACSAEQRCAPNECFGDEDCSDGEVCAGSECGRRCEPPAAAGELCFTRSDVERCDERKSCAAGLTCVSNPSVRDDGVCQ